MSFLETAEKWAWDVAARKLVVAVIGFLTSQAVVNTMTRFGIQVDSQKLQIELTAFLIGAFTVCHDWLKLKFPDAKWL